MEINELNVKPSQINLKSFDTKETLNPNIWSGASMKSAIRKRLLSIAMDFIETLQIDWAMPTDIIVVGSIAGYNWSKYSDIDLHVLYDFSKIDDNVDFVKNYFTAKKNEWNSTHKDLSIHGYDVETYVQDKDEQNASDGIYSLIHDCWIQIPHAKNVELDKKLIQLQAAKFINKTERFEEAEKTAKSEEELKKLEKDVKDLFKAIVKGRREGLKASGEGAVGNIVFKVLRRSGHLGKLKNLQIKIYDKLESI